MNRKWIFALFVIAVAVSLAFVRREGKDDLKQFMRLKLDHTNKVLEGIAIHDLDMAASAATEIGRLTREETWKVLRTPEYVQFSAEFERTATALESMARGKNIDGAALTYLQLAGCCFDCHRYLRDKPR